MLHSCLVVCLAYLLKGGRKKNLKIFFFQIVGKQIKNSIFKYSIIDKVLMTAEEVYEKNYGKKR